MEPFQDGGQQNTKSEHNEYHQAIEASHMNSEMSNMSQSSGEGTIGSESFSKHPESMHSNQMHNYPGYNGGNYGMGDQHGGMMAGNIDYNNQNLQFSGQFSHSQARPPYPGMPKTGMSPVRPGMIPPSMGMMPGSYASSQSHSQRMMLSQGMSQSGQTPTLNQLLQSQTSSSGQRFPGSYGEFPGGHGKSGEMIVSGASFPVPQGWNGNPRSMGSSYPQGSMPATSYRSQGSTMAENRRPSGTSPGPGPGHPHQGQYMSSAMTANAQRYMMGQMRPGHVPPMPGHGYNQQMPPHSHSMSYNPSMPSQTPQPPNSHQQQQQQHMYHGQQQQAQPPGHPPSQPSPTLSQQQQLSSSSTLRPPSSQGPSPKLASPAPVGMSDQSSNHENSHSEDDKGDRCGSEPPTQFGVASARPGPSPVGSTGSRCDTPASNSGAQVGSPMPPRPPSNQIEGQGHTSNSPMATQAGYTQQMMPPPMPGQMGYPGVSGGKMGGPGMTGTQIPPHYPQYNSQYPPAGYRGQPGMGSMPGSGAPGSSGAMPSSGSYPQGMYNGPNGPMSHGAPSMYNSMMGRSMPGYNAPYGPNSTMPMSSHYGSFNSHMGPGQGPGPGPGPGSGPGSGPGPGPGQPTSGPVPMGPGQMAGGQAGMAAMGQPGMGVPHGATPSMPGGKGAQAAAQAALMAAANSAGSRMPGRVMDGSPRMMTPQGNGSPSPGMMNHMGVGNLGNPSLAGMSNQIQQITSSSVTGSSKPSSPAGMGTHPTPHQASGPMTSIDSAATSSSTGVTSHNGGGGETAHLMSPMSGSDTQESTSRPSSTATPGQTADAVNNVPDMPGCDGSGSMPSSDSTSVDSGFHSVPDHSEKPPSESTPTHSSSPSNSNPPPSTNGPCEEGTSHESSESNVMNCATSTIPTSVHTSTTTTTVTSASLGTTVTPSITTTVSSEMQSAGSQTSAGMPSMGSGGASSNGPSAGPAHNGPHYPHPHPNMGYPMGPHGPMGSSHMMPGPGMHHPSMQHMGSMPGYNMYPGHMPNSMSPGHMPNSMPPGNMPSNMPQGSIPPGSIPPGNMPQGSMANNMPQGSMANMPQGSMASSMPQGSMANSMPQGSMANSMPQGSMASSMPQGSMASSMPQGSMANSMPQGSMANSMPQGSMANSMPQGSMANSMPQGSMASSIPPGHTPPGHMPNNMPSNMPNSIPPGNMPNAVPQGNMPNNVPPGNMPQGNMPPGNMPNNMPPGNMPNNMPPGNMPNNMPPGSMPPGNMPNSMSPGGMPRHMPPGNMPNNMPPGSAPNALSSGNMMNNSMGRGGMPNSIPPSSMPGSDRMANHMLPGNVPNSVSPGNTMGVGVNTNSVGQSKVQAQTQSNSAMPVPSVPDNPPEKKKKDEGVMVGAGPSYCEDYENSSSPGWPGMPKTSDVTRLYDMGNEPDRRPFLDRLFAFLQDKGTPLTAMPSISKQPLDLYRLYHCVGEKGGMVEVNKGKRWKEICSVVNIGTSASAAFTLKKNYIRYLFAFECKFDLGGLDPEPILQEIEAQLERKREQKKRVPSPGSQNSQDAFQQPPTPNSHMMEGFPGGPGMPPPYIQGPDGQMIPAGMGGHGPGMMMPNNMMGHPNMMHSHPGSGPGGMMGGGMGHGPNSMMMGPGMPSGGPGQGMMGPQGGMMGPQGGMMGPGGMMAQGMHMPPSSYGSGQPGGMMGPGSAGANSNSSLGPSPGPVMIGSSSGGANTAPSSLASSANVPPTSSSVAGAPGSAPNSRPPTADSVNVQDPFADEPGKASSPATFQHRPGGPTPSPTPGGFSSPGPPTTTSASGFGSRPSSNSNPSASPFPNGPNSEQGPTSFRRASESFPPNRSETAQFPYGHDSPSQPSQPFRPASGSSDPAFAPRFPGQQSPFRPSGPGEAFNSFSGHGPGMGPHIPGQDGFNSFPPSQHSGVRPPISREGSFSGPAGGCMSQYSEWNGAGSMGQSPYPSPHMEPYSEHNMMGRDGAPWSPMHAQRSYPPSSSAPCTSPAGPFGRPNQRGSPQARDKVLGKLQQKGGAVLPTHPFPPKKEIVFPTDSVEAAQPTLTKRRRLTHKDLGPVEAWRLMMALKSGLLGESTWAIDTLNILLFDDATITYFNLAHLPGLLEVLTEHFRAVLFHIFHILRDKELLGKPELSQGCVHKAKATTSGDSAAEEKNNGVVELEELMHAHSEASLDKTLYCSDYTSVSRQGKVVVKEEQSVDCAVLDSKQWDRFCNFASGKQHWQKGGGDITEHVVPCLESSVTHDILTDLFFPIRTYKEGAKDCSKKRKAATGEGYGVHHSDAAGSKCHQEGVPVQCSKKCKREAEGKDSSCLEEQISLVRGDQEKHSNSSYQKVHLNNVITAVGIKEEPREPELHCQADDSPPPPILPAAAQDCPGSCEDGVEPNSGPASVKDAKPTPPDLTREEAGEDSKEKSDDLPALSAEKELDTEKQETKQNTVVEEAGEGDEDTMTAEIVAMMIKEQDGQIEEEAYRHDYAPLTTMQADQDELGRRCVAISNIFRSLSCIPGNEALLSQHHGFMMVVGQLLMLHHWHQPRSKAQPAPPLFKEEVEVEGPVKGENKEENKEEAAVSNEDVDKDWSTSPEWWWDTLEAVRENALVVLANICSHMHMGDMDSDVCLPILDGLLHWMVCPSSAACDPLPSASSSSQLSPQRLVLEALCKLCIHDDNVDLLIATPPFSRILQLMSRLMHLLSERSQPVPREFSIVLLSRLVQSDSVAARALALQHPSISLLLEFLEHAEQSAMAVASQQGASVVQSNPEVMGTSLDMLRRAASILLHMARIPENRKLFLHHQSRLLTLVMSQILDASITEVISDVLFECSQPDLSQT